MPKMRLYGASALLDRRRTLEVSVRTMRNDFYFVKGEQIMLRKYVFGARFYVSDMFKCGSCGYATRIRVLGDTCTCPRCGATMRRL